MKNPPIIRRLRRAARQIRAVAPVRIRDGIGADLRMDLRRASAWYGHGTNEMPIQQALATHLRPGDTFYDVGANVGFFTLLAARLIGPAGHAVAFEPVPANAAACRRNAALNRFSNVKVVEAAVAAGEGTGTLVLAEHPGGAALAQPGAAGDGRATVTVPTVSIDALVDREEIPPPSMVKVDVEGAELSVLEGMARTAQRYHPTLICEADAATQAKLQPRVQAVRGLLSSWGYRVEQLAPAYPNQRWAVAHLLATPAGADAPPAPISPAPTSPAPGP